MKAKIKIGNIELEFEYETTDEFCEIYNIVMSDPVVENREEDSFKDSLEDVADRIRKAMKEAEKTYPSPKKYPQFPYDNPFRYWNLMDSYNPFPNKVTAGDV